MTRIEIAKTIARGVVGLSTSFVVGNVLRNNVNPETPIRKAEVMVGSMVIGAIVAEHAQTWTDRQIDEVIAWWNEKVKKAPKQES